MAARCEPASARFACVLPRVSFAARYADACFGCARLQACILACSAVGMLAAAHGGAAVEATALGVGFPTAPDVGVSAAPEVGPVVRTQSCVAVTVYVLGAFHSHPCYSRFVDGDITLCC